MAINKVEYGNETLIDLTADTVDEESVAEGITFHSADGEQKTGKLVVPKKLEDLSDVDDPDYIEDGSILVYNINDKKWHQQLPQTKVVDGKVCAVFIEE